MVDTRTGVIFEANLPPESEWTTWQRDAVLSIQHGLFKGLSPGFPSATRERGAQGGRTAA